MSLFSLRAVGVGCLPAVALLVCLIVWYRLYSFDYLNVGLFDIGCVVVLLGCGLCFVLCYLCDSLVAGVA